MQQVHGGVNSNVNGYTKSTNIKWTTYNDDYAVSDIIGNETL